jgi:hypothetical protein
VARAGCNAFSKKIENLQAAVSLHFAHYNFVRVHKTIRMTPATAAAVENRLLSIAELVERTPMTTRKIDPNAMRPDEDWEGNNAAFSCPACAKVFIVSGMVHKAGRSCPTAASQPAM